MISSRFIVISEKIILMYTSRPVLWVTLPLVVTMFLVLVPVSTGADRGHRRAARLSSIWDIILPPKHSTDVHTNIINTETKVKPVLKGCKSIKLSNNFQPLPPYCSSEFKSFIQNQVSNNNNKTKVISSHN